MELECLEDLFNLITDFNKNEIKRTNEFLDNTCKDYSSKKAEVYSKYNIDGKKKFNFFESISDKWYRENFHSDVLYTILNPQTPEIGSKYFMQKFVQFLGIEDRFDWNSDFEVIKEAPTGEIEIGNNDKRKGYIDLLIKNNTQAIIIENKINYAPDMENQLVRYMKYVHEIMNIETYTVVYLTLINDSFKKPPLDSYDKSFEEYTALLKNKGIGILKEVYALDEQKDLAKDFLQFCIDGLQEKSNGKSNIACVYLEQYKTLLEHLGGKAYMKNTDKELIKEIYLKNKFDMAQEFADFWFKRYDAVGDALRDEFKKWFPEKQLELKQIHGFSAYLWKSKKGNYYTYWYNEDPYVIGFTPFENEKFSQIQQDDLFKKFDLIKQREPNREDKTEYYVYCRIKDSSTLFDDVHSALKILFEN